MSDFGTRGDQMSFSSRKPPHKRNTENVAPGDSNRMRNLTQFRHPEVGGPYANSTNSACVDAIMSSLANVSWDTLDPRQAAGASQNPVRQYPMPVQRDIKHEILKDMNGNEPQTPNHTVTYGSYNITSYRTGDMILGSVLRITAYGNLYMDFTDNPLLIKSISETIRNCFSMSETRATRINRPKKGNLCTLNMDGVWMRGVLLGQREVELVDTAEVIEFGDRPLFYVERYPEIVSIPVAAVKCSLKKEASVAGKLPKRLTNFQLDKMKNKLMGQKMVTIVTDVKSDGIYTVQLSPVSEPIDPAPFFESTPAKQLRTSDKITPGTWVSLKDVSIFQEKSTQKSKGQFNRIRQQEVQKNPVYVGCFEDFYPKLANLSKDMGYYYSDNREMQTSPFSTRVGDLVVYKSGTKQGDRFRRVVVTQETSDGSCFEGYAVDLGKTWCCEFEKSFKMIQPFDETEILCVKFKLPEDCDFEVPPPKTVVKIHIESLQNGIIIVDKYEAQGTDTPKPDETSQASVDGWSEFESISTLKTAVKEEKPAVDLMSGWDDAVPIATAPPVVTEEDRFVAKVEQEEVHKTPQVFNVAPEETVKDDVDDDRKDLESPNILLPEDVAFFEAEKECEEEDVKLSNDVLKDMMEEVIVRVAGDEQKVLEEDIKKWIKSVDDGNRSPSALSKIDEEDSFEADEAAIESSLPSTDTSQDTDDSTTRRKELIIPEPMLSDTDDDLKEDDEDGDKTPTGSPATGGEEADETFFSTRASPTGPEEETITIIAAHDV